MALTSLPQSPPQVVRGALVDDDALVMRLSMGEAS